MGHVEGKFISLSTAIKKEKERELNELETKLKELENIQTRNQLDHTNAQIQKTRSKILDIHKKEEEKYKFLKQQFYKAGPKATKLLARKINLKKKNNAVNLLHN